MNTSARSVLFFILAGLMEIGGGYLMWLWLREKVRAYSIEHTYRRSREDHDNFE